MVYIFHIFIFCYADSEDTIRLYHRGKNNRNQLVVCDPELKRAILLAAHIDVTGPGSGRPSTTAGGIPHNGINTTRRKISDQYWWRRLVEDVRSYCKECTGCCHVPATITSAFDQSSLDGVNDSEDAGLVLCQCRCIDSSSTADFFKFMQQLVYLGVEMCI